MVTAQKRSATPNLALQADTAEEMMSPNPISVCHNADVNEALGLMTDRAFTVAPVIDVSGRAVGVVSITDI